VLPELPLDPEFPRAGGRDDNIVELEARQLAQPQTRQEADLVEPRQLGHVPSHSEEPLRRGEGQIPALF
jgi:hypothetical protein